MDRQEYEQVKSLNYPEYCNYLKKKYGQPKFPYYTRDGKKNRGNSKTREGLFIHHVFEDHAIRLSDEMYASINPYEWQLPENLVYCDFLEHLLLHILICESPSPDHNRIEAPGIGGVRNFIVPELNDAYSGYRPKLAWKQCCYNKVIEDKDVYFELVRRFKHGCSNLPLYSEEKLYRSFNEQYGQWSVEKDEEIITELKKL